MNWFCYSKCAVVMIWFDFVLLHLLLICCTLSYLRYIAGDWALHGLLLWLLLLLPHVPLVLGLLIKVW